jgi:voltage-gated potassium channel
MGFVPSVPVPRHAFPHLFFALLAFTILAPLSTGSQWQRLVYLGLTLAVLVAGIRLSWFVPRTRLATLLLAVPAIVAAALNASASKSPWEAFLLAFAASFLILMTVRLLRKIVNDTVVTADTLYGAACIYLLIGITWALVYFVISRLEPGAFYVNATRSADLIGGWPSYVYFSFVTLSTVGYGDITPATQLVRSVVILQVITGVFYVAVLIGRLVDLYRPNTK